MCLVVVRGWALARVVIFCVVFAHLCFSTRHCNIAIGLALIALGHDVLTMEESKISRLMIMYKPFRNSSVGFF